MDETQRYFIATIVGTPQRLVMGRQVRYDIDPTTATLPKKSAITGLIEKWLDKRAKDQKASVAKSSAGNLASMGIPAQAASAALNVNETAPPIIQSSRSVDTRDDVDRSAEEPTAKVVIDSRLPKSVVWALPSFSLVAALVYMGIGWYSEYQISTVAELQSHPIQPHPQVPTPMERASNAVPGAPLPMERVATALAGDGGLTVVNGPAPLTPVPQSVLQREGLPLERKIPTVVLSSSAPIGVTSVSPQLPQPAKSSAGMEKTKDDRADRVVVVDAPEARIEHPKDHEVPATRKFAQPVEVKTQAPQPQLPASKTPGVEASHQAGPTAKHEKVTVVDIPPDASYVLITNPQTRLPQRFAVGQKIWTGETIKSIDPKAGHLVLDSRTVSME